MSAAVATACLEARVRAIAVNNAWRLATWANWLHAADAAWWTHQTNIDALSFSGVKTCAESATSAPRGVTVLKVSGRAGYDPSPGYIRTGGHSGYQAIHIAAQAGAKRILLCGMDMREVGGLKHWHGDHPAGLRNSTQEQMDAWCDLFAGLRDALPGIQIINCTPGSRVTAFDRADLRDALCVR